MPHLLSGRLDKGKKKFEKMKRFRGAVHSVNLPFHSSDFVLQMQMLANLLLKGDG